MPRRRQPTLSPAWPSSSSLRNISAPVTTDFLVSRSPTISTSSPTLILPRSIRPVTTVPRPEIENTSSIGIRNGWALGLRDVGVERLVELDDRLVRQRSLLAVERLDRCAANDRRVVARELILR